MPALPLSGIQLHQTYTNRRYKSRQKKILLTSSLGNLARTHRACYIQPFFACTQSKFIFTILFEFQFFLLGSNIAVIAYLIVRQIRRNTTDQIVECVERAQEPS